MGYDIQKIRKDFPALDQEVYGKPLAYLDNAATTLKPQAVMEAISNYYSTINSNVHRGVHSLSQKATEAFENARKRIAAYINAKENREIIFTRGATESINLVAGSFGKSFIHAGDEVLITGLEHHANIVPWQMMCLEKGASLKVVPINNEGELMMDEFDKLLGPDTRMLAITHISNSLGTILPVKEMVKKAHAVNVPALVDGAQGIVHSKVDVQDLDCDFYCFSGHKIYGPMGIGVLYGKEYWLERMEPWQTGGEMIKSVTFEKTEFNELPYKFEAGTPDVAGVIGLETALSYLGNVGMERITRYEDDLMHYTLKKLQGIEEVRIVGTSSSRAPVISFLIGNIHPYDAGTIIDRLGIAVRTGHHCAQPVIDRMGLPGTIRVSLALYNTKEEIDRLSDAILRTIKMFS